MNTDTIASISTAPGESGIGIIRISGKDAVNITNKIYTDKNGDHSFSKYKTHTIHYGFISDENEILDEVMVSLMKAPNSYTKEDVVEINCHGGTRVCRRILDLVLSTGARIADPGEFTKRAFLNGRLDLTRAEAVMDTIRSQSDISLKQSVRQLRGSLYELLNNICNVILYEIAHIEAALDDPDSISLEGYDEILSDKTDKISRQINDLISSYDEGRIIKEGIRTVILGLPNAGKSSLLNILLNEDRAIVTDIPGTTRDALTESVRIGDINLVITDTAGIRQTEDVIENIGIGKAIDAANDADLIIYVADSTSESVINNEEVISLLKSKPNIILLNKADLSKADTIRFLNDLVKNDISPGALISTSMVTGEGIDELKKTIYDMFLADRIQNDDQVIITNLRHVGYLRSAIESLNKVKGSIDAGVSEDLYVIDLTDAYRHLASITGTEVSEDIVNEIFSKFCMGK
jgi:tRNA modification GTPase